MNTKHILFIMSILFMGILVIVILGKSVFADNKGVGNSDNSFLMNQNSNDANQQNSANSGNNNNNNNVENDQGLWANLSGTQPQLSITSSASVRLKGAKVISLSGSNLSVTVFGLPINITTLASTTTQFIGVADIAHVAIGDTLSVNGTIDQNSGIVTASKIQDESQRQKTIDSIKQQIQMLLDQIRALQAQIYQ